MSEPQLAIDNAISELDRLKKSLSRTKTKQVRSLEELSLIKATSLSWFNNHRSEVRTALDDEFLGEIDKRYSSLLTSTDKAAARSGYQSLIKSLRKELSAVRIDVLSTTTRPLVTTIDAPPNFSGLIPDIHMQAVLERRWAECTACVSSGAPLAAIVMMGGLLEGLLLARLLREPNKGPIFACSTAPRDRTTGKPSTLQDWTLRNYIDVAHEMKWISRSAKDVGQVLRDYRNYIHPQKELSHGIVVSPEDSALLWEIAKAISRELVQP